jgi:hypothetical protein
MAPAAGSGSSTCRPGVAGEADRQRKKIEEREMTNHFFVIPSQTEKLAIPNQLVGDILIP